MNKTNTKPTSRTDWEKIKNRNPEDIDTSDIPELGAEFFANAQIRQSTPGPHSVRVFRVDPETGEEITVREWTSNEAAPGNSSPIITIRVEPETLAWFRAQGEEAQNKMRAALRIYVLAHQK